MSARRNAWRRWMRDCAYPRSPPLVAPSDAPPAGALSSRPALSFVFARDAYDEPNSPDRSSPDHGQRLRVSLLLDTKNRTRFACRRSTFRRSDGCRWLPRIHGPLPRRAGTTHGNCRQHGEAPRTRSDHYRVVPSAAGNAQTTGAGAAGGRVSDRSPHDPSATANGDTSFLRGYRSGARTFPDANGAYSFSARSWSRDPARAGAGERSACPVSSLAACANGSPLILKAQSPPAGEQTRSPRFR